MKKGKIKNHITDDVRCPFYRHDDGAHRITCEGILDTSNISQYYNSAGDYQIQMNAFCCDRYRNCEIHTILQEKYAP